MKTRILVLASCLLAFASHAQESKKELWKWTDANGVVHYSDMPGPPGSTRVDLMVTEPASKPATAPSVTERAPSEGARPPPPATVYDSLEIWQPENEASFFEADATVGVRIRSEPDLAEGDRLVLYLDGNQVDGPVNSLSYTLENLERGAHSITAVIFDARGKERIRSQPVTFYKKQVTVIPPAAVGPNVRPPTATRPPRPTPRGG